MASAAIFSGVITGCLLMALAAVLEFIAPFCYLTSKGESNFLLLTDPSGITLPIGGILGAVHYSLLGDKIGRKHTLTILSIQSFTAVTISLFVYHQYIFLLAEQLLIGLSIGGIYAVVPVYLGEIAEKKVRGRLISFVYPTTGIANLLGMVVMQHVKSSSAIQQVFVLQLISALIAVIASVLSITMIQESPFYYVKIGNDLSAKSSLVKLRSQQVNHELEFIEIQKEVQPTTTVKYRWMKPLFLMMGILAFRQLSGIHTLSFFVIKIMQSGYWDRNFLDIVIGLVQVFAHMVTFFFVDKCGRKLPLLLSVGGISASFALLYALELLVGNGIYVNPYITLAITLLAFVFLDTGVQPISFILMGEIFPLRHKMMCVGASVAFDLTLSLVVPGIIAMMTFTVESYINIVMSLVVGVSFLGIIQCFYSETNGRSFNEIQLDMYKSRHPTKGFRMVKSKGYTKMSA